MKDVNAHKRIIDWLDQLASKGKTAFSIEELRAAFPENSDASLSLAINRLSKKNKVISISNGYYLIISAQYASKGILPPTVFLDGLMKYCNKKYYLALLNAAVFHGASHQQPQEFFVVTEFPQMRVTNKKGIKISYISRKTVFEKYTENRKTETGYIKISSPILTATDLVQFQKRVGSLSRVATVLEELSDEIKTENITEEFVKEIPLVTLQRLGYILDKILNKVNIAEALYNTCIKANLKFNRKPLSESGEKKGFPFDEKWKIIINSEVEPDI
jgi:predicted transcriptional regulator of viral defense system